MVRAKFICQSVTKRMCSVWNKDTQKSEVKPVYDYNFQVVTGGSAENAAFFASSPGGNIQLSAVNGELFDLGTEQYVDFTPALVA